MLLPKQTAVSYHYYLVNLLRSTVGIIHLLPACLSGWLLVGIKLLFFSLLGFAAWVRNFTDNQFVSWFLLALGVCLLLQRKICQKECALFERCTDQCCSETLRTELEAQRTICRTLEHVKAALETKSLIECQAERSEENAKSVREKYEDKARRLTEENHALKKDKKSAEQELDSKRKEIDKIRADFASQLDKLQNKVSETRSLESNNTRLEALFSSEQENIKVLEKENAMLRATVEIMTRQRKQMVEKHAESVKRVKRLSEENNSLSSKLLKEERSRGDELKKDGELKQLTERMQSSLLTAKGKLNRVGGVLSSDIEWQTRRGRTPESLAKTD